MEPRLKFIERR